jgi:hypothetical protein
VKQALYTTRSCIHMTVDLWTSLNKKPLIGVIGHYIGDTGSLQETVLALREIKGRHTGENLASTILEVIGEYGIASKLGYFVMDNADSNSKMMEHLSRGMSSPYIKYTAFYSTTIGF